MADRTEKVTLHVETRWRRELMKKRPHPLEHAPNTVRPAMSADRLLGQRASGEFEGRIERPGSKIAALEAMT